MMFFYLNTYGRATLAICYFIILSLFSSNLYAQCSSVSSSVLVPANSAPIEIDVNLDGIMDFSITNVSIPGFQSITITGLNGHEVLTMTTGGGVTGAAHVVFGEPICANEDFAPSTTLYNSSQGIGLVFAGSGGAYIGISNGTNIGFMNIQISTAAGGGVTVSYGEYGVGSGMNIGECSGIGAVAGDCSSLLPVELRSFKGELIDYGIQLKWVTESEYQNAGFSLERSLDSKSFESIHWIEGQGTRLQATEYVFEDLKLPIADTYYYRLLQVDEDGSTEYSEIIAIDAKSTRTKVSDIYPNPASLFASVELEVEKATAARLSIYRTTGECLQSFHKELNDGRNRIEIDIPVEVTETLFLKVELNNRVFYRSIMVLR